MGKPAPPRPRRPDFDLGDHLFGRDLLVDDLLQGCVAAPRHVVLEPPGTVAIEAGAKISSWVLICRGPPAFVDLFGRHPAAHAVVVHQQHRRIATGAHALALLEVNLPSAVVSLKSIPSFVLDVIGRMDATGSAQGRLVHTVILCFPTGSGRTCCRNLPPRMRRSAACRDSGRRSRSSRWQKPAFSSWAIRNAPITADCFWSGGCQRLFDVDSG